MIDTQFDFTFHSARPDELQSLMDLGRDAYSEYESVLSAVHWQKMKSNLEDRAQAAELLANSASIVCRHGEELAGVAYLVPSGNPTPLFSADWTYIRKLGVLPAFRGYGLGRLLTERCIELTRKNGEHT